MRAVLIDPVSRTVSDIDFTTEDDVIAMVQVEWTTVEAISPNALLVGDDSGLVRPGQSYFRIRSGSTYGGRMVLVGYGEDGRWFDAPVSAADLAPMVSWCAEEDARTWLRGLGYNLDAVRHEQIQAGWI